MVRIKRFLILTLLGGMGILLPLVLFGLLAAWLLGLGAELLAPVSSRLGHTLALSDWQAVGLAVLFIIAVCFSVGLLVKTGVGAWLHHRLEKLLDRYAFGYRTTREVAQQLLGTQSGNSLLQAEVVRAWIYGREVPASCTALLTCRHPNGEVTVYMPTAPVPTSGLVYHLPGDCVDPLPGVSVEAAMKTVIACGAGSDRILSTSSGNPETA